MHTETARLALQAGVLATTRELLSGPVPLILGDPERARERLGMAMPQPYRGRVADTVPFTLTPRTVASLASCGPRPARGAARFTPGDLAIAVVDLDELVVSGFSLVFCDRSPTRPDVEVSTTLELHRAPWDEIRASRFGADVDPGRRARYHAEALVYGACRSTCSLSLWPTRKPPRPWWPTRAARALTSPRWS